MLTTIMQDTYIKAKDGKLMGVDVDVSMIMSMEYGGVTMSMGLIGETSANVAYSFNESSYNAIIEDKSDMRDQSNHAKVEVCLHVGDMIHEQNILMDATVSADEGLRWVLANVEQEAFASIEWYTDAQYTTPLDLSGKTIADVLDFEVYAKVTVKEGWAFVTSLVEMEDLRSENYKIAFANGMLNTQMVQNLNQSIQLKGHTEADTYTVQLGTNFNTVKVNGELLPDGDTSFLLESKGFYVLTYMDYITDDEFSIFDTPRM